MPRRIRDDDEDEDDVVSSKLMELEAEDDLKPTRRKSQRNRESLVLKQNISSEDQDLEDTKEQPSSSVRDSRKNRKKRSKEADEDLNDFVVSDNEDNDEMEEASSSNRRRGRNSVARQSTLTTHVAPAERRKSQLPKKAGNETERRIRDVIRMCLFKESKKQSFTKSDVRQIIGNEKFEPLFDKVKMRLENIFGFKVVSWPTKAVYKSSSVKKTEKSSDVFSLCSIMEKKEREVLKLREDQQVGYGALTMVLVFIYLSQGCLKNAILTRYLLSIGFTENTLGKRLEDHVGDMEVLLDTWVKQGYLERFNQSTTKDPKDVEYIWGPRAKVEWNEDDIISFICEFYVPSDANTRERKRLKESVMRAGRTSANHLAEATAK